MGKKWFRTSVIFIYIFYFLSLFQASDFWGNILSPIAAALTAGILFYRLVLCEKRRVFRISGVLIALAVTNWAVCDVIWAYYWFVLKMQIGKIVDEIPWYSLTNLFLTAAVLWSGFYLLKNWNRIQLILDTVITTGFAILLQWILFLNQDIDNFHMIHQDWLTAVSLVLNLIVCIWSAIWFFSLRRGKSLAVYNIILLGTLIYALTDTYYYYLYFFKIYHPNSYLDGMYLLSFFIFIHASKDTAKSDLQEWKVTQQNIGNHTKGMVIGVGVLLLLTLKRIQILFFLPFSMILFLYILLTNYIQKNIKQNELIAKEKKINEILEREVEFRTKELMKKNQRLDCLLNHDRVTGLYSQRYFLNYLDKSRVIDEVERIIIYLIEINKLKTIRSIFGKQIGDQVINETAKRIQSLFQTQKKMLLSQYGEDTFAILKTGNYGYEEALLKGKELIALCSDIYVYDTREVRITLNIGISIMPLDAKTKEECINHAEIAIAQARMQRINKVLVYDKKLGDLMVRRSQIEMMLKNAVYHNEFSLVYQPQVDAVTEQLIGLEALIRWKTKSGEYIPPDEFISIAEETGCIQFIGEWVFQEVLHQIAKWKQQGIRVPKVAINVSSKQLYGKHFVSAVEEGLRQFQVTPKEIDIEITESVNIEKKAEILDSLRCISKMGISISLDDFGTGYSSLNYLKVLPIDRVKIAKPLIDKIEQEAFDYEIVRSLITISNVKKIAVLAEGVETESQWRCLRKMGCHHIQGYYFSRPLSSCDIVEEWLAPRNKKQMVFND